MGLQLEAIEDRWIVAGRDHHATNGLLRLDRKRNGRRWRRRGRENDLKAVLRHYGGGRFSESVREKAAVVANNNFLFSSRNRIGVPIICRRLCNASDICKSEFLRDDCTPSIRPELYAHK